MKIVKNRWIVILCAFLILCLLAGGIAVWNQVKKLKSLTTWNEVLQKVYSSGDKKKEKNFLSDFYTKKRNKPLSELSVYNTDLLFEDSQTEIGLIMGRSCVTPEQFNRRYPIERIEKFDNSHFAVVYRIKDEETEFYACLGFEYREIPADRISDTIYRGWIRNGATYYATSGLSSEDFSVVKEGDSAEKISKIDPSIAYEFQYGRYGENIDGVLEVYSFRLLKDGIYMITFRKNQEIRDESSPWWYACSIYQTRFYRYGELESINDLIHASEDTYPIKTFPRYILDE